MTDTLPLVYVGTHNPAHAPSLPRCMISANRLERRRKAVDSPDWIIDSGAFTRIQSGRGHMDPVRYRDLVDRLFSVGLTAAVSQDWMCEPFILDKCKATVEQHQHFTLWRYETLLSLWGDTSVYLMPVLQGWTPEQYADMTADLSPMLGKGAWVGVGSVCRRNSNPEEVYAVLDSILSVRSDLALHGFGVKSTSLAVPKVADRLWSVDSLAWSFAARIAGRGPDANRVEEALEWLGRVEANKAGRTISNP